MKTFNTLATVEEVLSHRYISFIGTPSREVRVLESYRDCDGNTELQGFEILWENGNKSRLTYWEGHSIYIAEGDTNA